MSRKFICLVLIASCFSPVISRGEGQSREQVEKVLESLKDQTIKDLEDQNAALQKEVARLKAEVAKLKEDAKESKRWEMQVKPLIPNSPKLPRPTVPLTPQPLMIAPPSLQTLPPGTIEKRINGEPFYVIPVSGSFVGSAARDTGVSPVLVAKEKR